MSQSYLFPETNKKPQELLSAVLLHNPVKSYSLFSGGDGSLAATHWYMENVPGCEVAHIDTGIGIPRTQEYVADTCAKNNWPLTIVSAKECGNDYDEIVARHGFPGPSAHRYMYIQLKERPIAKLVRDAKSKRSDKVLLLTGICHDDSIRRSGYAGDEITVRGAQIWANILYWNGKSWREEFLSKKNIERNPVANLLGMSGECLCGAFAKNNELGIVKIACQETYDRISRLSEKVKALHGWGWGEKPIKVSDEYDSDQIGLFDMPMCVGCLKTG